MSHKDDINVLSGRLHRIIGTLCDLEDDLGIIYDEPNNNPVKPDGFCAWGERKEVGDD